MELGHFDKLFVKNKRRKVPQGKILKLFPLDILKATFWMEDSSQVEAQLGLYFQNRGTFFRFSKKSRGGLSTLPPLLVACLRCAGTFLKWTGYPWWKKKNAWYGFLFAAFSENKFDKAGVISLNLKRYFKQSALSWQLSKV